MPSVSSTTASLRGIMMILSPAKTLDLSACQLSGSLVPTTPDCNPALTLQIAKAMKARKETELGKLLGISTNLAKTASQYWKDFAEDPEKRKEDEAVKPCIYSFSGAAYQGLQASECNEKAMQYLQDNLRIVDPLYGVLRPLDLMQPYRLEMATRKALPGETIKLADFWKESVTARLKKDLEAHGGTTACPILLNLASDEYSAAVDPNALPDSAAYVKVVFWEGGRTIAVHAKRARGLMARYLAENDTNDLEGVRAFAEEGYGFVDSESDETKIVFDRQKGAGAKRGAATKGKAKAPKKSKR